MHRMLTDVFAPSVPDFGFSDQSSQYQQKNNWRILSDIVAKYPRYEAVPKTINKMKQMKTKEEKGGDVREDRHWRNTLNSLAKFKRNTVNLALVKSMEHSVKNLEDIKGELEKVKS